MKRSENQRDSILWQALKLQEQSPITRRLDWILFALFCFFALYLYTELYRNSGALWRDETSTIHVASAPNLAVMWDWLSKDSAPALMNCLVRAWMAGPGATEDGLRFLGILVSLGVVVSLFVSCWIMTGRVPLVSVAMVIFNGTIFYFGSSLRSYGLAILLIMPCCAAFWRLARQPSRWNILASLLLAILSCHASYQNSYLLLAIGLAAAGTCAICGLWNRSVLILAIGFIAGCSMLIYVPAIRKYREASEIASYNLDLSTIWRGLVDAVSDGHPGLTRVWLFLCSCALIFLVIQFVRQLRSADRVPSLQFYALMVAVIAGAAGLAFFLSHGIFPYPWHYVPFLALAGILLEVSIESRQNRAWVWLGRMVVSCLLVALSLPPLWQKAHLRRTNMDRVSLAVARLAKPDDFVLVNPFYLSPGFKYHYKGAARWNTLPLTSSEIEVSLFPYAPVRRLMMMQDAIQPTLNMIDKTLATGNRLWIVGDIQFPPPNSAPPLPPAPLTRYGWSNVDYQAVWSQQTAYHLLNHARKIQSIQVDVREPVNPLENLQLIMIEGWQTR